MFVTRAFEEYFIGVGPKPTRGSLRAYLKGAKAGSREESIVLTIVRGCGVFSGAVFVYLVLWLMWASGVFWKGCEEIYGRECNAPHGICDRTTGLCKCEWYVSGDVCDQTPVITDWADNTMCSGNGRVSPLGNASAECAEDPPSRANGYRRSGGWATDACRDYVDAYWRKDELAFPGHFDDGSVPRCSCKPGFEGRACTQLACPSRGGNICSGNGNTSVSLLTENARGGNGCLCNRILVMADTLEDESVLDSVVGWRHFTSVYCGTLGTFGNVLHSYDDYTCKCDESHYSVPDPPDVCARDLKQCNPGVCAYGGCPKAFDQTCGGHGHRKVGEGFQEATTQKGGCHIRCEEGYELCPDGERCVRGEAPLTVLCGSALKCSGDTPVRCPDGSCAAIDAGGSHDGALEDLTALKTYVRCSERRKGRGARCSGYESVSPVVFVSFFCRSGSATLAVGSHSEEIACDYSVVSRAFNPEKELEVVQVVPDPTSFETDKLGRIIEGELSEAIPDLWVRSSASVGPRRAQLVNVEGTDMGLLLTLDVQLDAASSTWEVLRRATSETVTISGDVDDIVILEQFDIVREGVCASLACEDLEQAYESLPEPLFGDFVSGEELLVRRVEEGVPSYGLHEAQSGASEGFVDFGGFTARTSSCRRFSGVACNECPMQRCGVSCATSSAKAANSLRQMSCNMTSSGVVCEECACDFSGCTCDGVDVLLEEDLFSAIPFECLCKWDEGAELDVSLPAAKSEWPTSYSLSLGAQATDGSLRISSNVLKKVLRVPVSVYQDGLFVGAFNITREGQAITFSLEGLVDSVEVNSTVPFSIVSATFHSFASCDCGGVSISNVSNSTHSDLVATSAAYQNSFEEGPCVCDESCGRLGRCEDAKYKAYAQDLFPDVAYIDRIDPCDTGTQCGACGPSNRRSGAPMPGFTCDHKLAIDGAFSLRLWAEAGAVILFEVEAQSDKHDLAADCGCERCPDGSCAPCDSTYDCPGSGCIRINREAKGFTCACERGFDGLACQYAECTPADNWFGTVDPASACACGGPPPYRVVEQIIMADATFNDQWILRANGEETFFRGIKPTFAPIGISFNRVATIPGTSKTIYTTCPHIRVDENGAQHLFEDPGESWETITSFDDAPFRCSHGQCASSEAACELLDAAFPMCNGRGTCRADGTCECFAGFRTFLQNKIVTARIRTPYSVDDEGETQPTDYGEANDNWRSKRDLQCASRNCGREKCEAPIGCFPGTFDRGFSDGTVMCPSDTIHAGLCVSEISFCDASPSDFTGVDLEDLFGKPLPCGGKGIPVSSETGDEFCICGTVAHRGFDYLDPDAYAALASMGSINLEPNGWSGDACQIFECDASVVFWSAYDYANNRSWTGVGGKELKGKWRNACGCATQPDPQNIGDFERCCAQGGPVERLEDCTHVPCKDAAGRVSCLPNEDCVFPMEPQVFACSGRGTCLATGECRCDSDYSSGEVYVPSPEFAEDGCAEKRRCPSPTHSANQDVCNRKRMCEAAEWTSLPEDAFYRQQLQGCTGKSNKQVLESMIAGITDAQQMDFLIEVSEPYFAMERERALNLTRCQEARADSDGATNGDEKCQDSLFVSSVAQGDSYVVNATCDVGNLLRLEEMGFSDLAKARAAASALCEEAGHDVCEVEGGFVHAGEMAGLSGPKICQFVFLDYDSDCGPMNRLDPAPVEETCEAYWAADDNLGAMDDMHQYHFEQSVFDADVFVAAMEASGYSFADANLEMRALFRNDFSSRINAADSTSVKEEWCDMSLSAHFPVDCGPLLDPETNKWDSWCARDEFFCRKRLADKAPSGSIPTRPEYVLPGARTRSMAPDNFCVLGNTDLLRMNSKNTSKIGTCACGDGFGGSACQCPAIDGRVCNGVGRELGAAFSPADGQTKIDVDSDGCFYVDPDSLKLGVYSPEAQTSPHSQCVCRDVGQEAYARYHGLTASPFVREYSQHGGEEKWLYETDLNQRTLQAARAYCAEQPSFGDNFTKPSLYSLEPSLERTFEETDELRWVDRATDRLTYKESELEEYAFEQGLSNAIPVPQSNMVDFTITIEIPNVGFDTEETVQGKPFVLWSVDYDTCHGDVEQDCRKLAWVQDCALFGNCDLLYEKPMFTELELILYHNGNILMECSSGGNSACFNHIGGEHDLIIDDDGRIYANLDEEDDPQSIYTTVGDQNSVSSGTISLSVERSLLENIEWELRLYYDDTDHSDASEAMESAKERLCLSALLNYYTDDFDPRDVCEEDANLDKAIVGLINVLQHVQNMFVLNVEIGGQITNVFRSNDDLITPYWRRYRPTWSGAFGCNADNRSPSGCIFDAVLPPQNSAFSLYATPYFFLYDIGSSSFILTPSDDSKIPNMKSGIIRAIYEKIPMIDSLDVCVSNDPGFNKKKWVRDCYSIDNVEDRFVDTKSYRIPYANNVNVDDTFLLKKVYRITWDLVNSGIRQYIVADNQVWGYRSSKIYTLDAEFELKQLWENKVDIDDIFRYMTEPVTSDADLSLSDTFEKASVSTPIPHTNVVHNLVDRPLYYIQDCFELCIGVHCVWGHTRLECDGVRTRDFDCDGSLRAVCSLSTNDLPYILSDEEAAATNEKEEIFYRPSMARVHLSRNYTLAYENKEYKIFPEDTVAASQCVGPPFVKKILAPSPCSSFEGDAVVNSNCKTNLTEIAQLKGLESSALVLDDAYVMSNGTIDSEPRDFGGSEPYEIYQSRIMRTFAKGTSCDCPAVVELPFSHSFAAHLKEEYFHTLDLGNSSEGTLETYNKARNRQYLKTRVCNYHVDKNGREAGGVCTLSANGYPAFVPPDAREVEPSCHLKFIPVDDGMCRSIEKMDETECFRRGGVVDGEYCVHAREDVQCRPGWTYYDEFCFLLLDESEINSARGNSEEAVAFCDNKAAKHGVPARQFYSIPVTSALVMWLQNDVERLEEDISYFVYKDDIDSQCYCTQRQQSTLKRCSCFSDMLPLCAYARKDLQRHDADMLQSSQLMTALSKGQPGKLVLGESYGCACFEGWAGESCEVETINSIGNTIQQICEREGNVYQTDVCNVPVVVCPESACEVVDGVCTNKISGRKCFCKPNFGPGDADKMDEVLGDYYKTGCEVPYAYGEMCGGGGEDTYLFSGKAICVCDPGVFGQACSCAMPNLPVPFWQPVYSGGETLEASACSGNGRCCPSEEEEGCQSDGCECEDAFAGVACSCDVSDLGVCSGRGLSLVHIIDSLSGRPKEMAQESGIDGCLTSHCQCEAGYTGRACAAAVSSQSVELGARKTYVCGEESVLPLGRGHPDRDLTFNNSYRPSTACVCHNFDVSRASFFPARRKFVGKACQCLEIDGKVCAGNGVCVEPHFPTGTCEKNGNVVCTEQWHCETYGLGACEFEDIIAGVGWRNGEARGFPVPGSDEGGCECFNSNEEGFFDPLTSCEDCSDGYGPRRPEEWDYINQTLKGAFSGLSFEEARCRFPYAVSNVVGREFPFTICSEDGIATENNDGSIGCACVNNTMGERCEICPDPYGPKPQTSSEISCLLKGGADPELAPDTQWRECGGHGFYLNGACECFPGWRLDSEGFCRDCQPGYGPTPEEELSDDKRYCDRPWIGGNECSGYGEVYKTNSIAEKQGRQPYPCSCFQNGTETNGTAADYYLTTVALPFGDGYAAVESCAKNETSYAIRINEKTYFNVTTV